MCVKEERILICIQKKIFVHLGVEAEELVNEKREDEEKGFKW